MTPLLVLFLFVGGSSAQETQEETYSISLVQTAEVDKEIIEVEDKKVLAESYTIKKGDHLWQIFRERGLLEKRNLLQLLAVLKTLNKDLTNIDLIHPGEKIVIPLTITPLHGLSPRPPGATSEQAIPIEALEAMDLRNYTVQPGDSLTRVVSEQFGVPPEDIGGDYLRIVKGLNPFIQDLNLIFPNQVIRLPIYSPQVVRMPIEPEVPKPPETPKPRAPSKARTVLSGQLADIFTEMGEEWVGTGDHFIPLKAGGEVKLNANSFPVLNLFNGNRVIVDLNHELPEKMGRMITSSWENYRIVHLTEEDDLKGAVDKILPACGYAKIYGPNEPFEFVGDISVRITADWIIQAASLAPGQAGRMIIITMADGPTPRTPKDIKGYLNTLGIRVIDYPPGEESPQEGSGEIEVLTGGPDHSRLTESLLELTGKNFSRRVEIPIYQSKKTDFNLIVKADFLLNVDGKDLIIDLTGLGEGIVSLLREHRFSVLTLSTEKDPASLVSKTLSFLGIPFDAEPHAFLSTARGDRKNISITVPGITFRTHDGKDIFATSLNLPDGVAKFLSRQGYKILSLALS